MKRSFRMKLALAAGLLGVVFTDIPSSLARYHLPVPCSADSCSLTDLLPWVFPDDSLDLTGLTLCSTSSSIRSFGSSTPSGCSSGRCGSGAPSDDKGFGIPSEVLATNVLRLMNPTERDSHSSFSPGFFSHYDSQIQLFSEAGGLSLEFTSATAMASFSFVDGINGDSQDGVFHDLHNGSSRQIELLALLTHL